MAKLTLAAAAAALVLGSALAHAAPMAGAPQVQIGAATILAAAKKNSLIPANCTIDPFKQPKVYRCCTTDSSGNQSCTEHPLDHDFPLQMRLQKLQSQQPLILQQPGATQ